MLNRPKKRARQPPAFPNQPPLKSPAPAPIPIWANATYACDPEEVRPLMPESLRCGLTVDKNSARTWDGKPWRVVIPHE